MVDYVKFEYPSRLQIIDNTMNLGLLPPNTHFMTRGSLQPALCVLGGKLELRTTVTTVHNSSV